MGNPLLVQYVAMDLNGNPSALVDVSAYVRGADGVSKSPVRTDQFRDAQPATFSFVLENYDGRFTPGNPNSPYTNPVTERMQVCWSVGGQLRAGAINTITLAEDNWSAVTITCEDMLGTASRNTITASIADAISVAAGKLLMWRMDDANGSAVATEASGNGSLMTQPGATLAFAQPGIPGLPGTQVKVTS